MDTFINSICYNMPSELFGLFGLLSSSSLLSVQRFGRCAPPPRPSSGISCQTREPSEEGRRAHRPKRCTENNEDEDNSPNNADNTNYTVCLQHLDSNEMLTGQN